ncbi:hypothetical protein LCGC14_2653210, partial [marine sediment metagenome]
MTDSTDSIRAAARKLLSDWKGPRYAFGRGCLDEVATLTAQVGKRALGVANYSSPWLAPTVATVADSIAGAGVEVVGCTEGARPNAPREDVYRIADKIAELQPGVVVAEV